MNVIQEVANNLCNKFAFGYYDKDDIKQEIFLRAWDALDSYDESLPLKNFLYKHVKNRLRNLIRDKLRRYDPPCKECYAAYIHSEPVNHHSNHTYCHKFLSWQKRNNDKANLVNPLDIYNESMSEDNLCSDYSLEDSLINKELLELIDDKLPVELRSAYVKLRSGASLKKGEREELLVAIKSIMGVDNGAE